MIDDPGTTATAKLVRRRLVLATAVALLAAGGVTAGAIDDTNVAAAPARPRDVFTSGETAVRRLGLGLPDVAARHGVESGALRRMLLTDRTLAVDRLGNLAYFDELPPDEPAVPAGAVGDEYAEPSTTAPEFRLATLPGAAFTIYLDFDGHTTVGTTWNTQFGITEIVSPPFDRDGDPSTWSPIELQIIRDSWAVVAEDYAPWQVNVTTIDPGPEALRYSGAGDPAWGVRAVVTKDTFANCGCGGHAYIGAFADSQDEPAFVYNSSFVGVSEAISHEVGHTLYLAHDGTTTGSAYYAGHDDTGPGWAPIMGASYYKAVGQWSQQEYFDANNATSSANYGFGADDVSIISNTDIRNLPIRDDDHGSPDAPTILTPASPSATGTIATRSDIDAFAFTTVAGVVSVSASPSTVKPNLDIALTLRDGSGTAIASSNPIDDLGASIVATVPGGTYVVEVDGVGVGNPLLSPPSGYTDYGSLGRYTIAWSVDASVPQDTTPPAAPTDLSTRVTNGDVELDWAPNAEDDLAGYVVQRDGGSGFDDLGPVATPSFTDPSVPVGPLAYRVVAVDQAGNRSVGSNVATVESNAPTASRAEAEQAVAGSVAGTFAATTGVGGGVQTIGEAPSLGKPTSRHDLLEHRWTLPALTGRHTLTIHASTVDGGDADDGVRFEVSDDATSWSPVLHVPGGSSVATSIDIGQRSGPVHVRVVDTDRSIAQAGEDRVSIDFLALQADGVSVPAPAPSALGVSITPLTWGSERGEQFGVAVVSVTDDMGDPIEGVAVVVRFGAPFTATVAGTTGIGGVVHLVTSVSARKPAVSVCLVSVAGPLPYAPGPEAC